MTDNRPNFELLTIRQFVEKHRAFTEGGLRYLIFNKDKNGFAPCIKRMGRKILLDEHNVFEWLESHQ